MNILCPIIAVISLTTLQGQYGYSIKHLRSDGKSSDVMQWIIPVAVITAMADDQSGSAIIESTHVYYYKDYSQYQVYGDDVYNDDFYGSST